MTNLPPDFREKALETLADHNEKALYALIRAIRKKSINIDELIEIAGEDLRSNFNEGHANSVWGTLTMANASVIGILRKTDPALDDPSKKDLKEWPRL